eukprot:5616238-Prorocentrum_lima.AAC.1
MEGGIAAIDQAVPRQPPVGAEEVHAAIKGGQLFLYTGPDRRGLVVALFDEAVDGVENRAPARHFSHAKSASG